MRAVPAELQGRVGSLYLIGVFGGIVVGQVLGGVIARIWGVTGPFWFAFVGSALHPRPDLARARPHRPRRRGAQDRGPAAFRLTCDSAAIGSVVRSLKGEQQMSDGHKTSRRRFIGAAAGGAAAAGAMGTGASGALAHGRHHGHGHGGGDIPARNIGIQLFTVRDLLADNELDLPGTFEVLGDAGYALVEVGGTYDGRTAAEFRALANQHGLKPEGSHVPGGGNAWRGDRSPIFADAEGARPAVRRPRLARRRARRRRTTAYEALAAEFDVWGAEARAQGLKFYFHNHPTDFALDGGTPIYDTLLAETDPRLVWFELDIAWIEAGGQSAVRLPEEARPTGSRSSTSRTSRSAGPRPA